jgi:hypothetical protein
MKIHGGTVLLPAGLMLPENIGDVGHDVSHLDLSDMGLVGTCMLLTYTFSI